MRMSSPRSRQPNAGLQIVLLVIVIAIFLYLALDVKQLLPSSEIAEIAVVIVGGELVLMEILFFRSFYRRRVSLKAGGVSVSREFRAEKRRRPTFNHFILFSIVTFDLFLLVPAYVVSLPSLAQGTVYNILTTLVTVQGILLGLLGVSALQLTGDSRILKPLVGLTIISILVSVSAVMFGEASTIIPQTVLAGFFLVAVIFFTAVVGVYSWFILETRASQGFGSGTRTAPPEQKRLS